MKPVPIPVEPLDYAIVDLLCLLPVKWRDHDPASLTATEETALQLMQWAGLVEFWVELRATMEGRPEELVLVCSQTLEKYADEQLWEYIFEMLPEWLDEDGQTRGRPLIVFSRKIRLSHRGENARIEHENQTPDNPSGICAFVRRRGSEIARHPPVPFRSVVKSCRILAGPDAGPAPTRSDAAEARGATGDTTIKNTARNNGGEAPEGIRAEMENPAAPTAPGSNAPFADSGREGDRGRENDSVDPPLTANEVAVIATLAMFDPSKLAGGMAIEAMMIRTPIKLSRRTIQPIVIRLIELGLAERPFGRSKGVRLTVTGRRIARKLAY
jgi:hypothetical protein